MFDIFKKKKVIKPLDPTKVAIGESEYVLELNMYTMKKFGESLGVDKPIDAIKKLSILEQGLTFEGQDIFAKLVYHCTDGKITERACLTELENQNISLTNAVNEQVKRYTQSMVYFNTGEVDEKKKVMK